MWGWWASSTSGDLLGELTAARDRKVTWRLRDQGEASLKITSTDAHDQARLIEELRTDLCVTWNRRSLWRGRFGPSSDAIGPTTHEVEFGAVDYRGVLARRYTREDITLSSTDIAEAGWDLIAHTQTGTGGSLGIGRGTLPAIATADVEYPVGKSIGEAIDELGGRLPGFDWWVDADMVYRAAAWRGSTTVRDFALIHGTTVEAATVAFDSTAYANTVIQTGADGLDPAIVSAPDLATRVEGRWEAVESNTDLTTQDAVDDSAPVTLARRGALPLTYSVRLKPGVWTPDDLWVGDLARIVIRSGRKDIDTLERVLEVSVSDSPDGPPAVDLTLGNTLAADVAALLRRLPARLTALARRT